MSSEIKEQYTRFIGRQILFIFVFLILLILISAVSALLGSADIPATDVYATILNRFLPAHFAPSLTETIDVGGVMAIVWDNRLRRILIGVAAGVGLAFAGATMQGYLRIHSQARIRLESHRLPVLAQRVGYCSTGASPEAGIIRSGNSWQGRSTRSPQPNRNC